MVDGARIRFALVATLFTLVVSASTASTAFADKGSVTISGIALFVSAVAHGVLGLVARM